MQRALVTGGTGTIGEQILRDLAATNEYEVTFQFGMDDGAAARIGADTGAIAWKIDLTQPFTLERSDFDILINSAAVLLTKTLVHEIDESELTTTINVNLLAPFRMCQQCLPFMMEQRYGRIVNIGSIYAERGCSRNSTYNMSKHGLLGLTRSLAHEYAEFGIAVNQVDPSAVESKMMERIAADNVERGRIDSVESYFDDIRGAIPVGRMASPEDVSSAVLFLIRQSGFTTGVALPVDGGVIA